jgi:hypothetical protein
MKAFRNLRENVSLRYATFIHSFTFSLQLLAAVAAAAAASDVGYNARKSRR